jgi:beta-lactam-binding protein with PASTA domain
MSIVPIPSVADGTHTEADARRLLTEAGLYNVVSTAEFDPNAPKGLVVAIAPSPGTVLCPRDSVTIKVTH